MFIGLFKVITESKSPLPIPELSSYHCVKHQFQAKMICFENYKIK